MKKNPQFKTDTFWIYTDFLGVMRVQRLTCTPARKYHQWRRLPQSRLYAATFSNIDWLFFLKKTFYGTYMGRKQLFESFLKMDALSS